MRLPHFNDMVAGILGGDEPTRIDEMVRYCIFHGAQSQFTPASQLAARLYHTGLSQKFVGRAALSMLTEGLQDFATLTGICYRVRKGCQRLSSEEAIKVASSAIGIKVRMAQLSAERKIARATSSLLPEN